MKKIVSNLLIAFVFATSSIVGASIPMQTADAASCTSYQYRRGDSGTCVQNIQKMLNGIAYEFGGVRNSTGCGDPYMDRGLISIDGSFGPETKAKVIRYQYWACVKVDGVVGPQTWAKLCKDALWYGTTKSAIYDAGYYAALRSGC